MTLKIVPRLIAPLAFALVGFAATAQDAPSTPGGSDSTQTMDDDDAADDPTKPADVKALPEYDQPPPTFMPTAGAQPTTNQYYASDDDDDRPDSRIGIAAEVGGGVTGFTDDRMRDLANTGGAWTARLTIGTRMHFAAEVAYNGSAQELTTLGLDDSAMLISSGAEALARWNILADTMFQPYAFVGAGWRHYDLTNTSFNTSSVNDSDNVAEIPVGAGLAFRYEGLIADARFDFRPAFDNELVNPVGDTEFQLHNWTTSLRIGWEF